MPGVIAIVAGFAAGHGLIFVILAFAGFVFVNWPIREKLRELKRPHGKF